MQIGINMARRKSVFKQISESTTGALGLPDNLKDGGKRFSSNLRNEIRNSLTNPGVILSRVLNPARERGNKIQPDKFYVNKARGESIVTDNPSTYLQEDNGQNHLISFKVENTGDYLVFRMANFNGLTDSITVNNTETRYFGRPEPFYLYQGVSRNISFNFDVVIQNGENTRRGTPSEIDIVYSKLNTLMSLAYPHSYTTTKMVEPNILKLSIGDYLTEQPFFISTITYTASDDVVYYEGKPSIISVSVQGNLVQSEQYPSYEIDRNTSFIWNSDKLPEEQQEQQKTKGQIRREQRQQRREDRRERRKARRSGGSDSTTFDDTFAGVGDNLA